MTGGQVGIFGLPAGGKLTWLSSPFSRLLELIIIWRSGRGYKRETAGKLNEMIEIRLFRAKCEAMKFRRSVAAHGPNTATNTGTNSFDHFVA